MREPTTDDCLSFSYTSGTTGDPKGVKLSHKMLTQMATAVNTRCSKDPITEADSYISYLPGAHVFEQAMMTNSALVGLKIGFFGGDVLKLTADMAVL